MVLNNIEFQKKLGELIKNKRKKLKLSEIDLANKVGYLPAYIKRIENGIIDIPFQKLLHIFNVLKIDLDDDVLNTKNNLVICEQNYLKLIDMFTEQVNNNKTLKEQIKTITAPIGQVKKNRLAFGTYVGDGSTEDNKKFTLICGATTMAPVVQYENSIFTLSWEDILSLAERAGLFKEDSNDQKNVWR